jgi:hypothetical protein
VPATAEAAFRILMAEMWARNWERIFGKKRPEPKK